MSFIRATHVGGIPYFWLVENRRIDGKHRQRKLAYLGKYPTIPEAIDGLEVEIEVAEVTAKRAMSEAGAMVAQAPRKWRTDLGRLPRPDVNLPPLVRDKCRTYWQAMDRANRAMKRAGLLRDRLVLLREVATDKAEGVKA